jgi:hypothetical protein
MAEEREKELRTALENAQASCAVHQKTLATYAPVLATALRDLHDEQTRFLNVWKQLSLVDAGSSGRVPDLLPLNAPRERWHSDHAPWPLTLVTMQAGRV